MSRRLCRLRWQSLKQAEEKRATLEAQVTAHEAARERLKEQAAEERAGYEAQLAALWAAAAKGAVFG